MKDRTKSDIGAFFVLMGIIVVTAGLAIMIIDIMGPLGIVLLGGIFVFIGRTMIE